MGAGRVAALLGITAALAVAGCTPYNYVVHGPSVSAGVAAEIACAGVFVSHRTLDDVVKNDVERLSPLTAMNSYRLDRAGQSLSVTALHLVTRTAVYRPGIGCTLLVKSTPAALRRQAEGIPVPATTPRPAPPRLARCP